VRSLASSVMAGLVRGHPRLLTLLEKKTWMPGQARHDERRYVEAHTISSSALVCSTGRSPPQRTQCRGRRQQHGILDASCAL
jgi:hypothetical protein